MFSCSHWSNACSFKRLAFSLNPLMNRRGSALWGGHKSGQVKEIAFNHKGMRPSLLTSDLAYFCHVSESQVFTVSNMDEQILKYFILKQAGMYSWWNVPACKGLNFH